MMLHSANNSVS